MHVGAGMRVLWAYTCISGHIHVFAGICVFVQVCVFCGRMNALVGSCM